MASDIKYIVIYRPHNELVIDTTYYGPFESWSAANDLLCSLPALGIYIEAEEGAIGSGVKFIQELTDPNMVKEAT